MATHGTDTNASAIAGIAAGILGGVVFAVFFVLLGIALRWSLAAAVGAYVAARLIARGSRRSREHTVVMAGIPREELERALREGRARLVELRSAVQGIADDDARQKGERIAEITEMILQDIEDDPKDLRPARQFLNYYLDATITIVSRYAALSRQTVLGEDARTTLEKVETTLDIVQRAFEKQLANLMQDDVMDLDVEIEVLERTIRMEGLGDL